jgi:small subunit ribosomal protein S6|tara:strand:+ start:12057 stop:12404 length:348 start_codon:yes stop_codon:yes gene_type:complete
MNPVLSEEQMRETVKMFTDNLKDKKAQILNEEYWGLKKLKYPIQKKNTGFYYFIEFEAEGSAISELEILFKRDERVMRWLTIRLDKYSIEYSERRRKRLNINKQEEKEKKEEIKS